jgi:hypothetical protein
MKRLKALLAFSLVFGLLASVGMLGATPSAQAQQATPIPGGQGQLINPPVSQQLAQKPYVITQGEQHWFTFGHRGGNAPVHIWMDADPNEGAGFSVFTAEDAMNIMAGGDRQQINPIGAGTPNPLEPGWLFWRGQMEQPGDFYVLIEHGWAEPVAYDIFAFGPGVTAAGTQQVQRTAVTPAATPTPRATPAPHATPTPQAVMDGYPGFPITLPGQIVALDNPPVGQWLAQNQFMINQGEVHWFAFKHEGGGLPMHIWMDPEPNEGAGFTIYREEDAMNIMRGADRRTIQPVGAGTANPNEPGWLFWRTESDIGGRYYVLVNHGWADPVTYGIYAAGPGFVPVAAR